MLAVISLVAIISTGFGIYRKIPWLIIAASVIVGTVVAYSILSIPGYISTHDVEIWNGSITDKQNIRKNCQTGWSRSEDPFCTNYTTTSVYDGQSCTGSGKDRQCINTYHTEYSYDYSWEGKWFAFSSDLKKKWEIPRVDRQGAVEPLKYSSIAIGDPASIQHSYVNWIRGASDNIFHEDGEVAKKYKDQIPDYPDKLYEIWKLNRVLTVGVDLPNIQEYNFKLSRALKYLGPQRQMNAIIVVVDGTKIGSDYPLAVRRAWKGFKKNDAVIFIGINSSQDVVWSNVLSWSKNDIFNVDLRQAILEDKKLDIDKTIISLYTLGKDEYVRREMSEFEYLKDSIQPSFFCVFLSLVVGIISSFLVTLFGAKFIV